jgi:BirA family biotin operon repressor/biotin-[acetyl-CoA-carboxylase] ligase
MDVDVIKAGSEPHEAHVLGVDDECRLEVRYADGTTETLSSGEISIRL